jgi:hypothetical protein
MGNLPLLRLEISRFCVSRKFKYGCQYINETNELD